MNAAPGTDRDPHTPPTPDAETPPPPDAESRRTPDAGAAPHRSQPARDWLRAARDFVYPPACTLCHASLANSDPLCGHCRDALAPAAGDVCRRCCAPVGPLLDTTHGCIHCRQDRFAFVRAIALGAYEGTLRDACLRMKHDPSPRLAGVLADLLLEHRGGELPRDIDVVVPIPAHWTTRLMRLAAPADAIATRVAAFLKAPCDLHILRKSRRTPRQACLPPARRRENLRNAFRLVSGVRVNGTRVLLVDDVLTTGTTASRAARVLAEAGAAEIHAAVIARGIGH